MTMKTLNFKIEINAPKEKIWTLMWEDAGYRKWASVFGEGTYAVSDWKEGSSIQFLMPEGAGMNSVIEKKIENEFIAFKHLGMVKNFEVMPPDETSKEWEGAMETYRLTKANGNTILEVTLDTTDKYVDYFNTTFVKALAILKELSEK